MSAQTGMHGHSASCCTVPPIVDHNYEGKGKYETIAGMKTYVTGKKDSTKAIFMIMDIFGFFPQTIQGADILGQQYQVFLPDAFDGKPADISWYPPDNKEKEEKLGNFFQTTAAPPKMVEKVPGFIDAARVANPQIKEWGVLGFCWGGKIVSLTTGEGTPFKCAAEVHPAMIDPSDAEKITVPIAMLPSKDESKDDVEKWTKALKVKHFVKTYDDQVHGWLAARADLKDKRVLEQYKDGYQTLLHWFHENL